MITVFAEIKKFFGVGLFAVRIVFHPRRKTLKRGLMKVVLKIVELDSSVIGLLKTGLNHIMCVIGQENRYFVSLSVYERNNFK